MLFINDQYKKLRWIIVSKKQTTIFLSFSWCYLPRIMFLRPKLKCWSFRTLIFVPFLRTHKLIKFTKILSIIYSLQSHWTYISPKINVKHSTEVHYRDLLSLSRRIAYGKFSTHVTIIPPILKNHNLCSPPKMSKVGRYLYIGKRNCHWVVRLTTWLTGQFFRPSHKSLHQWKWNSYMLSYLQLRPPISQ